MARSPRLAGQTDMARLTRLVILMGSETLPSACYNSMGSETLPSACYIFPTNLVYPFTLRVTRKNAIVEYLDLPDTRYSAEYLDYQIPVTQLGDMQAANEIKVRHLPAVDRLSVMGVRVGVLC